jgi:hypothetical protein
MDRYTIIVAVISSLALGQRLLREDVKWFPSLIAPWRGLVVAVSGMVVAPTLDAVLNGTAVLQALITGVIAVLPTILNIVGGLTARKARNLGPTIVVMVCVGFAGVGTSGCAAFQTAHKWADTAEGYVVEAQARVDELSALVRGAMAILNVTPDARAEVEKAIAAAQKALAAAVVASGAASDTLNVFDDFVKAWDMLVDAATPYLAQAAPRMAVASSGTPRIVAIAHRKGAQ